jgi:hypothetical protein
MLRPTTSTFSTPCRFNGKEQDAETGLCYYGAVTSQWRTMQMSELGFVGFWDLHDSLCFAVLFLVI